MESDSGPTTQDTPGKYSTIKDHIANLRVKDIRHLFMLMRKTEGVHSNYMFPKYGMTCGEFSTFYVLNMPHRSSTTSNSTQSSTTAGARRKA